MKNLLILVICAVMGASTAQDIKIKTVGEFSEVKVYDLINVKMVKSDENKIEITGKNRNDVEVVNKNGKLKIRMNLEEIYDGGDTTVTLYYSSVDIIDANEGSVIEVRDTLDQFEIDLKAQEGAEITAQLKTKYANIRAVTGGIINASGTSKNQDVSIYTGGTYNAKDLITESTEVNINAAGEARINATEAVNVRIRAGGDVFIYGNPKTIDQSRVFGGRIKQM